MSKKSNCSCGKHKKGHHNEMTQSESLEHVKECLENTIEQLECIKETLDKIEMKD